MSKVCLDLPKTKGMVLTLEDRILIEIFNEKGCTTSEISKKIRPKAYSVIRANLDRMTEKGYVYFRNDSLDNIYYLTKEGVNEVEYRINFDVYDRLITVLLEEGFYIINVYKFLKDRFYNYYFKGEWNEETLVDQYRLWCEANELDLYSSRTKKLTLQN